MALVFILAVDAPSPFARAFTADLLVPSPATVVLVFKDRRRRTKRERELHRRTDTAAPSRSSAVDAPSPLFVHSPPIYLLLPQPPSISSTRTAVEEQVPSVCSGLPGSSTVLFRWPRSPIFVPSSDHVLPLRSRASGNVLNSEAPLRIHRRFGATTVYLLSLSSAAIRVAQRSPASVHYHLHSSDSVAILFSIFNHHHRQPLSLRPFEDRHYTTISATMHCNHLRLWSSLA
ncbi:hypothetical protein PIB30_083545 [Stylosanthes scabra]|uniref:Secreted protein n=1 Tax=Stylosanthes scabra TaxID=79078 RepID=A0ABU6TRT1_9FABA|nr:hypothetical protein [Stylosanthes scabra]